MDIDETASASSDKDFMEAWSKMEAKGFIWSEGNIEKAHLGWQMAKSEIARLQSALEQFGEHDSICPAFYEPKHNCDCGLRNALGITQ